MNLLAFTTPLAILGALWLLGITKLSKGGTRLAKRSTIGLLAYGTAIIVGGQILEAFHSIPKWISGSEGYGIIIPLFIAGLSILLGLISSAINAIALGKRKLFQETQG
ncbi:hypothetical protein [Erythrobacter sp.]|uniref:hypothetical protein n=1 Tax=Erythrobacter sp. TaxID=1042 RepID=UPI003C71020F